MFPLELGLRTPTSRCGHLSGPSRTRRGFFDFEVGGHDGVYKGRVHVIVPFVGRKNGRLFDCQQSYNVLVLRVPRQEEGVMFGGCSIVIDGRNIHLDAGRAGTRRANIPSQGYMLCCGTPPPHRPLKGTLAYF